MSALVPCPHLLTVHVARLQLIFSGWNRSAFTGDPTAYLDADFTWTSTDPDAIPTALRDQLEALAAMGETEPLASIGIWSSDTTGPGHWKPANRLDVDPVPSVSWPEHLQSETQEYGSVTRFGHYNYNWTLDFATANDHAAFLASSHAWFDFIPWLNEYYYDPRHSTDLRWRWNSTGDGVKFDEAGDPAVIGPCPCKPIDAGPHWWVSTAFLAGHPAWYDVSIVRQFPLRRWRRKQQNWLSHLSQWDDMDCASFSDQPLKRTIFPPPALDLDGISVARQRRYLYEFGKQCP